MSSRESRRFGGAWRIAPADCSARAYFWVSASCWSRSIEYGEKVRDGIVATTNEFFMFYYVLTGIHLLHLLIGLGVLAWMRAKSKSQWSAQRDIELMECGGLYWHMVDLLWVALFTLLYLVR